MAREEPLRTFLRENAMNPKFVGLSIEEKPELGPGSTAVFFYDKPGRLWEVQNLAGKAYHEIDELFTTWHGPPPCSIQGFRKSTLQLSGIIRSCSG